ncbi:MAG TPA: phenylalanine 4-monooxygenase [Pyrinomonadaceae bacterium]|jgi:phenylalanine-4-hydroxylase
MPDRDQQGLLRDHVDVRIMATDLTEATVDRHAIVQLDPEHPGFRDEEYRARRNRIALIAMEYQPGGPIPDAPYTAEEHGVWRAILEALGPTQQKYACHEYLECIRRMDLPRERIPQLREVTEKVLALSGFRLEPVAGLVEPRVFLESLARGVFLSTQYIRHHSMPLYTPEPDVAHEVIGHAVTLASQRLAELNRLFGHAVERTRSVEALERLARVYWFTIEFGVLREGGVLKAYGTGLLSSAGELEAMHEAELRPLDLEAASRQEYDPTRFQPVLYCADSFEEMYERLRGYLIRWS